MATTGMWRSAECRNEEHEDCGDMNCFCDCHIPRDEQYQEWLDEEE